ncbi:MAG: endonuclease III [Candidatus Omnitrophica bacterium]|nr:endonuclease III [Candidatus Omnitrophota bacterium]
MLSVRTIDTVIQAIRAAVRHLPDPSVTLVGKKWRSPYLVLISCLLSLRTKDSTTLPAAERLFRLADSPFAMVKLTVPQIERAIFPVGFYHTKARRIIDISRDILERCSGQVPDTLAGLLTLKGVGRKTANLVLVEGFGKYGVCVDTHVHRISNRFGFVETCTPDETEEALRARLPKKYWREYNALLVLWGQNVCRPVSPKCSQCPVRKWCEQVGVAKQR